ncbi:MAG: hypothetical protein KGS72_15205 [Cyanobacteria bacterium REEB67]|nr:hypothetical protein [Cyanobacteria bacterium REEB67]
MTDQDYVYGVFADVDTVQPVVSQLHRAGLQTSEICVLGKKSNQFKIVSGKIEDPTSRQFVWFGIGGAIAGLIAGIAVSLHIPGVNGFQLIVPLMGTIAGGACFPYFMCQLMTFLTSNKPQHWANVFEGTVDAGSVIIMAEPKSAEQRQAAMEILLKYNPVEMIFRKSAWGHSASEQPIPVERDVDLDREFQDERKHRLTAVA